jgi:Family of unknown function (DUF5694)
VARGAAASRVATTLLGFYDRGGFLLARGTMIRIVGAVLAAVIGVFPLPWSDTARAADAPPEIMIVGMVHMDNPDTSVVRLEIPDVLLPQQQAEIASMTESLARFKPTQVHVESENDVAARYARYLAGELQSDRDEIVQVAFRLAKQLGLAKVHASDARIFADYGPVQAFVAAHGPSKAVWDDMLARAIKITEGRKELLGTRGLLAYIRHLNEPEIMALDHTFQRWLLPIGEGKEQPGPDVVATWYRRNVFICAKIIQAAKPGERLAVFFGASHSYLLRQCISETPGFKLVDANDYLPE